MNKSHPHWQYFIAIESDLERTARYVEIAPANFKTYSIEFARILLSASSEVDVVSKLVCEGIDRNKSYEKIDHTNKGRQMGQRSGQLQLSQQTSGFIKVEKDHTMRRTEFRQKRWLTFTYLPDTMVNKPWLTANEQLAASYNSLDQAEIGIEYAKAFGIADSLQIEPSPTSGPESAHTHFRIVTVEPEEPRNWRSQFPADVAVPPEIDTLITQHILADTSWGNDSCPSFRFAGYESDFETRRLFHQRKLKPSLYSLWVDYPDINRREFGDHYKRLVLFYDRPTDAESTHYDETYDSRRFNSYDDKFEYVIFQTDDVGEMVDVITERFFQQYVWTGGTTCPWPECGGGDIESYAPESLSFDSEGMNDRVRCNQCRRQWTDLYRLVSISVDEGE